MKFNKSGKAMNVCGSNNMLISLHNLEQSVRSEIYERLRTVAIF